MSPTKHDCSEPALQKIERKTICESTSLIGDHLDAKTRKKRPVFCSFCSCCRGEHHSFASFQKNCAPLLHFELFVAQDHDERLRTSCVAESPGEELSESAQACVLCYQRINNKKLRVPLFSPETPLCVHAKFRKVSKNPCGAELWLCVNHSFISYPTKSLFIFVLQKSLHLCIIMFGHLYTADRHGDGISPKYGKFAEKKFDRWLMRLRFQQHIYPIPTQHDNISAGGIFAAYLHFVVSVLFGLDSGLLLVCPCVL